MNFLFQPDSLPIDAIPELYHYTSPAGLLGIAKGRAIWLSHGMGQNDSQEGRYYAYLIEQVIKDDYLGREDINKLNLLTARLYGMFTGIGSEYLNYTLSFSERADQLSQWRGYCPKGGFCFSLNKEVLIETIKKEGFRIGRCLYKIKEQKNFIRKYIIGNSPDEVAQMPFESDETKILARGGPITIPTFISEPFSTLEKQIIANTREHLDVLLLFKHPAFKEEREWRVIPKIEGTPLGRYMRHRGIKFRTNNYSALPYIEAPLAEIRPDGSNPPTLFNKVIIGPNPSMDTTLITTKLLLDNYGRTVELIPSAIPYRNW